MSIEKLSNVRFDGTITLGNILVVMAMLFTVFGWAILKEKQLTTLEYGQVSLTRELGRTQDELRELTKQQAQLIRTSERITQTQNDLAITLQLLTKKTTHNE